MLTDYVFDSADPTGSGDAAPVARLRDSGHGRRSRRQWSRAPPRLRLRTSPSGVLGALGRDAHRKEGRHRGTRRRLRRANRGLHPLRGPRWTDGDHVAALFCRGWWSPSDAIALSTPREGSRPSGSRRSTRRRFSKESWRRSVSAPPAGIYSTQRSRRISIGVTVRMTPVIVGVLLLIPTANAMQGGVQYRRGRRRKRSMDSCTRVSR